MLDINNLLTPFSETSPCGEDLSFARELDMIQEARREDDASLDQGEWVTALKEADWPAVVERCSALLAGKSKDIRLVVWLTEALAKTEGFAGLAQGYELLAQLIDRYWDQIHPLPEDGDHEQRIGNLVWLLSRGVRLVREIPVTEMANGRYTISDYDAARTLQFSIERESISAGDLEGRVTLAQFEVARRKTPREFLAKLVADVVRCSAAFSEFERAVDARLGVEGPSFGAMRDALESASLFANRLAKESGVVESPHTATAQDPSKADVDAHAVIAGPFKSRAQALAQLRVVADYFRHTEPHSPVAYLADKAARWGEMPLHDWLRSVIKDDGALLHIEELLGLDQSRLKGDSDG